MKRMTRYQWTAIDFGAVEVDSVMREATEFFTIRSDRRQSQGDHERHERIAMKPKLGSRLFV